MDSLNIKDESAFKVVPLFYGGAWEFNPVP